MNYSIPKGVFDILPSCTKEEDAWKMSHKWQHIFETARHLCHLYGFEEMMTPIFEKTELFARSIGEETDIISKEMYTFTDKGNRSMTLRPEGTAPSIRAFIEKKLFNENYAHKLFYLGPMFRYERQQAGRYRQFYQLGVEAIGTNDPEQDVEILDFLMAFFKTLGLGGLTLYINSIGNQECRKAYRSALVKYLTPLHNQLSTESQHRLKVNPLRILDSKSKEDQKILENAPSILDYLEEDSKVHFEKVLHHLKVFNIPFVVNDRLVRGLDYYNRTVFEIVCGDLGAHDTLAAGGRYDQLIKTLGGPDLPAVGFAMGIERLIQTMMSQKCSFKPQPKPEVLLIPMGAAAQEVCFELTRELRFYQVPAEMDFSGKKLKQIMKYADKKKVTYVCIVGEDELQKETLTLREMSTGDETPIALDQFVRTLINLKS